MFCTASEVVETVQEEEDETVCEVIRTGPKYQAEVPDWVLPTANTIDSEKGLYLLFSTDGAFHSCDLSAVWACSCCEI
jgi:hypothetical protein